MGPLAVQSVQLAQACSSVEAAVCMVEFRFIPASQETLEKETRLFQEALGRAMLSHVNPHHES